MANKITDIKLTPSKNLANVIGKEPVTRPQATKKIWDYIKANGLQDKKNKRCINADAKLKPIFGGKTQITMFELTKFVGKELSK